MVPSINKVLYEVPNTRNVYPLSTRRAVVSRQANLSRQQGTVGFGTYSTADSPLLISEAVSREPGTKKRSVS